MPSENKEKQPAKPKKGSVAEVDEIDMKRRKFLDKFGNNPV